MDIELIEHGFFLCFRVLRVSCFQNVPPPSPPPSKVKRFAPLPQLSGSKKCRRTPWSHSRSPLCRRGPTSSWTSYGDSGSGTTATRKQNTITSTSSRTDLVLSSLSPTLLISLPSDCNWCYFCLHIYLFSINSSYVVRFPYITNCCFCLLFFDITMILK